MKKKKQTMTFFKISRFIDIVETAQYPQMSLEKSVQKLFGPAKWDWYWVQRETEYKYCLQLAMIMLRCLVEIGRKVAEEEDLI